MAYQIRYELEFLNQLNDTCKLEIYEDRTGDPVDTLLLDGSANPITQRSIDNDRSLFTPIRGQELTAEIVTDVLSITDFIADDELKFKGVFTVNGDVVFTGFLVQEDSQEDFVSYKHIIRLKFTDGLGLLKGVELTDGTGLPWHSTPTVYQIIKACLNKTGNSLPINIKCKLFPSDTSSFTTESSLNITKLYTRSFMSDQRSFKDCYAVLSEIMTAYGCMLYQYRGEWVIDRIGDRHEGSTAWFNYSVSDTPTYGGTAYDTAAIGQTEGIKEVEQPLLLSIRRTARDNRITYRFNQWQELIRNLDLDEGANVVLISDSTQKSYDLDYWTLVSRTAYSRRVLDALGSEKERYLFIDGASDNLDLTKYVQSQSFPCSKGDKVSVNFSASTKTDIAANTQALIYVKCGAYYLDDDGTWSTGATTLRLEFLSTEDTTLWKSYSIESDPIPADGDLELRLLLMSGCGSGNETRYKDISVDYVTVLSNSSRAKGDFNRYPNAVTRKNPLAQEVTISDSLRKVNNGALLKSSGALEVGWQRGSNTEEYRFSQLNAFSYYQSSYRSKMAFDGTFLGTHFTSGASEYPVGFWPGYTIADAAGKTFMVTSLDEINWLTGIWRATMVEVRDETLDADIDVLPDNYEYNFIFD